MISHSQALPCRPIVKSCLYSTIRCSAQNPFSLRIFCQLLPGHNHLLQDLPGALPWISWMEDIFRDGGEQCLDHTNLFSRFTLGSVLGDHCWQYSRDYIWSWELKQSLPPVRKNALILIILVQILLEQFLKIIIFCLKEKLANKMMWRRAERLLFHQHRYIFFILGHTW